ncbi:MAG TPA: cyclic nucleotide-binding domain-containing protein [Bacteroidetes bacterium]|nr:cyclic nucleotide-binding domain-containing protein [Bacteroidota bacterium]
MKTIENILAEHPFFKGLEPKYLKIVVGCASNVVFAPEQIIYREGDPADRFFLIREGKIGLEINVPHKGPVTLQTINEGEILGWSWLMPPYKWRFTSRVYERTRAIALDGACLRKKCDEDHALGYEFYKRFADIIVQRLQATRLQLLDVYGVHS